jgi:hypothetical protein
MGKTREKSVGSRVWCYVMAWNTVDVLHISDISDISDSILSTSFYIFLRRYLLSCQRTTSLPCFVVRSENGWLWMSWWMAFSHWGHIDWRERDSLQLLCNVNPGLRNHWVGCLTWFRVTSWVANDHYFGRTPLINQSGFINPYQSYKSIIQDVPSGHQNLDVPGRSTCGACWKLYDMLLEIDWNYESIALI